MSRSDAQSGGEPFNTMLVEEPVFDEPESTLDKSEMCQATLVCQVPLRADISNKAGILLPQPKPPLDSSGYDIPSGSEPDRSVCNRCPSRSRQ